MIALRNWFSSEIERWISWMLPFIIHRSLKTGLHGVWAKGNWERLPKTGFILAANHHSWWDSYLIWLIKQRYHPRLSTVMQDEQLKRFQFFRRHDVISHLEVREALRRLKAGTAIIIFPEGELCPSGQVALLHEGTAFLAEKSSVPIYPVAMRVVMRGAQHPEAFVLLGEAIVQGSRQATTKALEKGINHLLCNVEQDLAASNPEKPLEGFVQWYSGQKSFSERTAWVRWFWQ